jgi:hypothetical protein
MRRAMTKVWKCIKTDREAMFLGIIAILFLVALYPLCSSLFYWETWFIIFIISLPFLAIFLAAKGMGSYMKDLRARGVITERDEFWVNMICLFILFGLFLLRR